MDDILAPNVGRKLVLVDACRDVPQDLTRGARNTKGIEGRIVSLPEDTAVFFSCRAGQLSFERSEVGHGLFSFCVLEGLRGAAVQRGELSWSSLVAHVGRRMTEPDLTRYMPQSLPQVPILAGAMPHTVLGIVEEAPAISGPAAAVVPPMPNRTPLQEHNESDELLRREFREFETALRAGNSEIGSEQGRKYIADRAAQRFSSWRASAEGGSAVAQFFVARCLQLGLGTAPNERESIRYYQQAAEGGIGLAWNAIGAAYHTGRGVEKNLIRAAECYRQGAELGCATAMYNLAKLYEGGYGVPKSPVDAFEWYRRAAEAGEPSGMNGLGVCYEDGLGVAGDLQQARAWFERSAALGNTSAMANLGRMYYQGRGVAKDYHEARRLFKMGADLGDPWCMTMYGEILTENGTDFEDDAEGIRWMRKAWEVLKVKPNAVLRESLIRDFRGMKVSPPP